MIRTLSEIATSFRYLFLGKDVIPISGTYKVSVCDVEEFESVMETLHSRGVVETYTKECDLPVETVETPKEARGVISKGEDVCFNAIEKLTNEKFKRQVRPDWLRNPETGRCLELDIYSKKLRIAVEYNGRQHYEYVPFFHKNGKKDLEDQIRRDTYKADTCNKHGVHLITVPYNIKNKDIEAYIAERLSGN